MGKGKEEILRNEKREKKKNKEKNKDWQSVKSEIGKKGKWETCRQKY